MVATTNSRISIEANRLSIRGSPHRILHKRACRLLQEVSPAAVFHNEFLYFIAQPREFQSVAKAITGANHGLQPGCSGRIRKSKLKVHGGSNGNGAWDVSADSASAEAVGPPEGSIVRTLVGK
jgi:hypothetical protein